MPGKNSKRKVNRLGGAYAATQMGIRKSAKPATLAVLKSIVDPTNHYPVRPPAVNDVERTAILKLAATSNMVVEDSLDAVVALTRSPACPVWTNHTRTFLGSFRAMWGVGASAPALPHLKGMSLALTPLLEGAPGYTGNGTGFLPRVMGIDRASNYWMFVPYSHTCRCQITSSLGTITGGTWVVEYEYTQNFSTTETKRANVTCTIVGGELVALLYAGAFVRPLGLSCVSDSTTTSATVTAVSLIVFSGNSFSSPTSLTIASMTPFWASPPEMKVADKIYAACRLTAASILISNASAKLYKEGAVNAVTYSQSMYQDPILDQLGAATLVDTIVADEAVEFRYTGLMEKGVYTFTVPDPQSMNFRDCYAGYLNASAGSGGTATGPVLAFYLDGFDYVNLIKFSDWGVDTKPQKFTVQYAAHHEFRNTSMLWRTDVSTIPLEVYKDALRSVYKMKLYYENPAHLAMIAGLARTAVARALPYAAPVLRAGWDAAKAQAVQIAADTIANLAKKKAKAAVKKPQRKKKVRVA